MSRDGFLQQIGKLLLVVSDIFVDILIEAIFHVHHIESSFDGEIPKQHDVFFLFGRNMFADVSTAKEQLELRGIRAH